MAFWKSHMPPAARTTTTTTTPATLDRIRPPPLLTRRIMGSLPSQNNTSFGVSEPFPAIPRCRLFPPRSTCSVSYRQLPSQARPSTVFRAKEVQSNQTGCRGALRLQSGRVHESARASPVECRGPPEPAGHRTHRDNRWHTDRRNGADGESRRPRPTPALGQCHGRRNSQRLIPEFPETGAGYPSRRRQLDDAAGVDLCSAKGSSRRIRRDTDVLPRRGYLRKRQRDLLLRRNVSFSIDIAQRAITND